eukprot:gene3626-4191_t
MLTALSSDREQLRHLIRRSVRAVALGMHTDGVWQTTVLRCIAAMRRWLGDEWAEGRCREALLCGPYR